MTQLRYSKEFGEVVEIRDSLSSDEALQILSDALLGEHYYITDPVSGKQANAIIVRDILRAYASKKKHFWRK